MYFLFPPRAVTEFSRRILISQTLSEGQAKTRRVGLMVEDDAKEGKEKRRPTNKNTVDGNVT